MYAFVIKILVIRFRAVAVIEDVRRCLSRAKGSKRISIVIVVRPSVRVLPTHMKSSLSVRHGGLKLGLQTRWPLYMLFILLELGLHFEDSLSPARVIVSILIVSGWRGLVTCIASASALAQYDRPSNALIAIWRRAFRPSRIRARR